MDFKTSYTLSLEKYVEFLKGRTVVGEISGEMTPDGLGWGVELGPYTYDIDDKPIPASKALFISQWEGDEAKQPKLVVYENPRYQLDESPGCTFLGTHRHFDDMTCEYKIVDLYICDNKAEGAKYTNSDDCPTFLARLGNGEGNYYYGQRFRYAEMDASLREAISRATDMGLFVKEDYPQLTRSEGITFSIGSDAGVAGQAMYALDPNNMVLQYNQPINIVAVNPELDVEEDYDEDEDEDDE